MPLKGDNLKKFILIILVTLLIYSLFGCSSKNNEEVNYHVLIVEAEEDISGVFGEFANNEYSVVEIEYLTSLESANENYPDYDIQNAPTVFILKLAVVK
jgi:hypothetical protein